MHNISIAAIAEQLQTDLKLGLTTKEAEHRILKHGRNEIAKEESTALWIILLRQVNSPIVFLLLFAAALSLIYAEWADVIAVAIVLLINTCIGFLMEYKAERSMNALRKLTKTFGKVIRNGVVQEIPVSLFVPGDILFVEAGDVVSADARICSSSQLQADESALTGESIPSEKQEQELLANIALADRHNMLFKGTFITRGNGNAIVVATGMNTELGKIASLVASAKASTTPIEKKLEQFSKKLIWITLFIALSIFITGLLRGKALLDMLNTVIALSVAAIPEGLPIVATLALAHGMMKMARRNVIVKKLASVETLGGTNIICTDKTGTLTYNKITVSHIMSGDFHSLNASARTTSAQYILDAFVLCNNAHVSSQGEKKTEVGDPLEIGLLQYAKNNRIDILGLRKEFPKILEEPFKSETKIMATLHEGPENTVLFSKGAAESIIELCSNYVDGNMEREFTKELKMQWLKKSEVEASEGLKVIAFAMKKDAKKDSTDLISQLTFLGIAGLIDPPREDVTEAIRLCRHAGIRVVMITGDHPSTARNIATQIGIISDSNSKVIEGSAMPQFEELSKTHKLEWKSASVFARVSPGQKLDLIQVLQEDHNIIAMTGDGVNDAPALKKADIGIAMGLRGTDVAKEVADMVLKDDSFSSIVLAVKEGRIIFENIRKFLMYLLSSNLSEILVIATLFVTGSPLTLVPLQILFINLLSDVFPALALGFNSGSDTIMNRPPRDPRKPVLSNTQWMSVIIYAVIIAASTFTSTSFTLEDNQSDNVLTASTVIFYTLILCQLFHVFSVGDHRQAFFKTDIFRNWFVWGGVSASALLAILVYFIPPARELLHLGKLEIMDLLIIGGCGFQSFIFIQVLKRLHVIH